MKESRVVIFIESSRWHLFALADLGSIVGSHLLTLISLREIQSTFPFSPTVIEAVIAGLAITVIYTARAAYLPGFPRLLFTRNRCQLFLSSDDSVSFFFLLLFYGWFIFLENSGEDCATSPYLVRSGSKFSFNTQLIALEELFQLPCKWILTFFYFSFPLRVFFTLLLSSKEVSQLIFYTPNVAPCFTTLFATCLQRWN